MNYYLEESMWRGTDWSPWVSVARSEDCIALVDIAKKTAKRVAYNWRARVIQVIETIET